MKSPNWNCTDLLERRNLGQDKCEVLVHRALHLEHKLHGLVQSLKPVSAKILGLLVALILELLLASRDQLPDVRVQKLDLLRLREHLLYEVRGLERKHSVGLALEIHLRQGLVLLSGHQPLFFFGSQSRFYFFFVIHQQVGFLA